VSVNAKSASDIPFSGADEKQTLVDCASYDCIPLRVQPSQLRCQVLWIAPRA